MDTIEERYEAAIRNFAAAAYRNAASAGSEANVDKGDTEACAAWHHRMRTAHNGLAAVMILRRIRIMAPELMADLVDQMDLAAVIGELGLLVQLSRYLTAAGGSPETIDGELHYMAEKRSAA